MHLARITMAQSGGIIPTGLQTGLSFAADSLAAAHGRVELFSLDEGHHKIGILSEILGDLACREPNIPTSIRLRKLINDGTRHSMHLRCPHDS